MTSPEATPRVRSLVSPAALSVVLGTVAPVVTVVVVLIGLVITGCGPPS
jgi:hypothetical protein